MEVFAKISAKWLVNQKTTRGLDVLEAAVLIGVLGDALLRAPSWGINVLLFTTAILIGAISLLAKWRRTALKGEGRWLVLPLVFFAAAFAWRDSPTLQLLDTLALLLVVALSAWRAGAGAGSIRVAGIGDYALGTISAAFNSSFGCFPLLLTEIHWKELSSNGWRGRLVSVARGFLIAVPLLMIFGALFMAADAVFEQIMAKTLRIDFNKVFSHIFLTLFVSWTIGGLLRWMLVAVNNYGERAGGYLSAVSLATSEKGAISETEPAGNSLSTRGLTLGVTEVWIIMGTLDALFLSFVLIQIRYLFGGALLVQASTGLTYAEYARRGFFELATVATLVLPLLLSIHLLIRKEESAAEGVFRKLASMQIVLLFVIMASAVVRMRLYQAEYGLTELRLYTTVFMGWLALVFIWFGLTVLRGQRKRFACGALIAGFLIASSLHLMNPDDLIVRSNAGLIQSGHAFDAVYAASLSADSVPGLLQEMNALNHRDRCIISKQLLARWSTTSKSDWRAWNWARGAAYARVREESYKLEELSCPQENRSLNEPPQ